MNIGERLVAVNGRPSGFDYMRIVLAVSVMVWHSLVTTYGPMAQDDFQAGPFRSISSAILPMFFSLSGFLVAGSLERCKSLVSFIGLRFIRIYPALSVEVLISAFILGPLVTSLSLDQYFTDRKFLLYLINITGHIHYELPGVFLENPNPERVNGQLWTVPFELLCYISLAALAAGGFTRNRTAFLIALIVLWIGAFVHFYLRHGLGESRAPSGVPGLLLVVSFLFGIAVYLWRDRLPWSAPIAVFCGAVGLCLMSVPIIGDFLMPPAIAYFTVWLGLCNPERIGLLRGADYSYGVFLYGYVIQQAWMTLGPPVQHWWINLILAIPTATLFAAFSWHYVEKPALNLRNNVMKIEKRWLSLNKNITLIN